MLHHAILTALLTVPGPGDAGPAPAPAPAEIASAAFDAEAALATAAQDETASPVRQGFRYTFVELNGRWLDSDFTDEDMTGWEARGSLELPFHFFLQATYSQVSDHADIDEWRLGLGYHVPVGDSLDLYGMLSYAEDQIDGNGFDEDESGPAATAGVRFWLAQNLELDGEAEWVDLDGAEAGLGAGARVYLMRALSLGGMVKFLDEDESFTLGVRLDF